MPFFTSIVFATFFAIIFHPLFSKFKNKLSASFSAFLTVLSTIAIILIPLGLFVQLVAKESLKFAATLNTQNLINLFDQYKDLNIAGYTLNLSTLQANIKGWLAKAGEGVYLIAKDAGSSIMNFSFLFLAFLFLYYYLLKDGTKILTFIKNILPFKKSQNTQLLNQCQFIAGTVFKGSLISALIAGLIAFIGFYIFKVPGALIWSILATIFSLIPTIGTMAIYLLAAITLIPTAGYINSIYLLIYFVILELIVRENFIKPALLDNKFSIHPVLIFFALIGGIQTFGSMGLLYGPLIVILLTSILKFSLQAKGPHA